MRVRVWDLPTRIFHWALVACVIGAFVTAKIGGTAMLWHGRLGLTILGLLVFRLAWGVVGSTYARFATFVRGPAAVMATLKHGWDGAGHNPLGALSVLAMLAVLSLMVGTGLFGNDDIAFEGPLYALVGKELSDRLTGIHHLGEKAVIVLVLLHVAAIAFYARVKRRNLVKPMLTGIDDLPAGASASGGGLFAFFVAAALAAAAVFAASGALLPPPPPPPAAGSAPDF